MIPQQTVQQILDAADVVEVVGEFVSLKKRGGNLMACCPFHNEKTPSFSVSPSKGIYKCFGCGKGGDAVRFLMDLEGFSYPEALKWLANKYSIEVQEKELSQEDVQAQNERESLLIATEFAQKYYHDQLLLEEEGRAIGLSYFKERGFNLETIQKFGLGYSKEDWSAFTKQALKSGYKLEILEKSGLSIVREDKEPIDRFKGRVIFPIHSVAGRTIAFGARILKPDPKAAKYLNSPESEIYYKSKIVYGIFQSKNAIRNENNCFLVEGYTDVVSLHQGGIENVVASSGTSLTKEQVQLIGRFSENITMLYDGDSAGINASLRGTDIILEEGLNVRVVVFPDGEDPDSYIQKVGAKEFKQYVKENQTDFIHFKTKIRLKEVGTDSIRRAELIAELVETINKIPNPIQRAIFFKETAALLEISEELLVAEANKLNRKKQFEKKSTSTNLPVQEKTAVLPALSHKEPTYGIEEQIIRDLVLYGAEKMEDEEGQILAQYFAQNISEDNFKIPVFRKIFTEYLAAIHNDQLPDAAFFSRHPDAAIQKIAIDWLSPMHLLSTEWEKFEIFVPKYSEKLSSNAYKGLLRIKKAKYEDYYLELVGKMENDLTEEEQDEILDEINAVKDFLRKVSEDLGAVL